MKKNLRLFFLFFISYLLFLISAHAAHAASLEFDEASYNVDAGDTLQVQVVVNPGSEQITSIDAYVKYDSGVVNAQAVTAGSYFPTVLNDLTTGRVYVAGVVDNPSDFKTGTGIVATITFKAVADGTTTLTYNCQTGSSDTSKVIKNDINSTNIITCAENGSATVTVGTGVSTSGSSAVASSSPTPTTAAGGTSNVSQLPQSGIVDNMVGVGLLGVLLFSIGGILKIIRNL